MRFAIVSRLTQFFRPVAPPIPFAIMMPAHRHTSYLSCLFVTSALLFAGCSKTDATKAEATTIRTAKVELHDISDTIDITGEVVPVTLWEIKSEISGRVIKVNAQPGEFVTDGQILVELDRTKLESDRQEAQRLVEAADISARHAVKDLRRLEALYASKVVTEKALLDAQVTRDLALNQRDVQRARLESMRQLLIQAVIKAPHEGMVLQHTLREGQVIVGANSFSQGTVLMPVADVSRLLVEANINEIDSPRIKVGMPVTISFDTMRDQSFPGTIETVAPSATMVEKLRVFPIRIRFDGEPPPVKPGISANIALTIEEVKGMPSVPLAAVFADYSRHFVFLKQGDRFVDTTVGIGVNDIDRVQIRSGVEVGDEVALTRPLTLNQK